MVTVSDATSLMKDFPINDLYSATTITSAKSSVSQIFMHLRKIRQCQEYSPHRALRFSEAISRDLQEQILKILSPRKLLHVEFDEFDLTIGECMELFTTWDDEYERFSEILRNKKNRTRLGSSAGGTPMKDTKEVLKMSWRTVFAHRGIQNRLYDMKKFRQQHEELRKVIQRVLAMSKVKARKDDNEAGQDNNDNKDNNKVALNEGTSSASMEGLSLTDGYTLQAIDNAYNNIKSIDGLDVSPEGEQAWQQAKKLYEERIDQVETKITAYLREQLGVAKSAKEMFSIFKRFNVLFVRDRIRGAIREYQTQLLQRVSSDIEALRDKFKQGYQNSTAKLMSRSRDIGPTSGHIYWCKILEHQLNKKLAEVENVLGKGWTQHVEGKKLYEEGQEFREKLNTEPLVEQWKNRVSSKNIGFSGAIFTIEATRAAIRINN